MFRKENTKRTAAGILSAAMMLCSCLIPNAAMPASADNGDENFGEALALSLYFYDANMCGTDVTGKDRLPWRGNCHIYDAKVPMQPIGDDLRGTNLPESYLTKYADIFDPDGDGFIDVAGGFHDAGEQFASADIHCENAAILHFSVHSHHSVSVTVSAAVITYGEGRISRPGRYYAVKGGSPGIAVLPRESPLCTV